MAQSSARFWDSDCLSSREKPLCCRTQNTLLHKDKLAHGNCFLLASPLHCRISYSKQLGIYHEGESTTRRDDCHVLVHVLLHFTHPPAAWAETGMVPGAPQCPGPGTKNLRGTAANTAYHSNLTLPTALTCQVSTQHLVRVIKPIRYQWDFN